MGRAHDKPWKIPTEYVSFVSSTIFLRFSLLQIVISYIYKSVIWQWRTIEFSIVAKICQLNEYKENHIDWLNFNFFLIGGNCYQREPTESLSMQDTVVSEYRHMESVESPRRKLHILEKATGFYQDDDVVCQPFCLYFSCFSSSITWITRPSSFPSLRKCSSEKASTIAACKISIWQTWIGCFLTRI